MTEEILNRIVKLANLSMEGLRQILADHEFYNEDGQAKQSEVDTFQGISRGTLIKFILEHEFPVKGGN